MNKNRTSQSVQYCIASVVYYSEVYFSKQTEHLKLFALLADDKRETAFSNKLGTCDWRVPWQSSELCKFKQNKLPSKYLHSSQTDNNSAISRNFTVLMSYIKLSRSVILNFKLSGFGCTHTPL